MAFIEVSAALEVIRAANGSARPVLRDVSLDVERGEFVSIVGTMGSGKSTLLSIARRPHRRPTAAGSPIGGEPVRGVRADAAFVFQNYSLLPWFTRARERPAGRRGGVSRASAAPRSGAGPARARTRRARQRPRPPARSAVRRHAPARRHCPRLCHRTGRAVSRRAVRRARCADPRDAAAGPRSALLVGGTAGHDRDDHQQRRGGDPALGPDRSDAAGTARHAGRADSGATAAPAHGGAARPR